MASLQAVQSISKPSPASGAAHSLQNLAPGLLLAPHRGHLAAIGEAHSLQNFAPVGFSAEHRGQCMRLKTYRL